MRALWMKLGLRPQVAIVTSTLMVALAWSLSWLAAERAEVVLERRTGEALVDTATNMAELLDRAMWSRASELRVLTSLAPFREMRIGGEVEEILATLQRSLPVFTWVGLTDRDGVVRAATDGILVGVDISARPVFQQGIRGFFIGDVHEAVLLASKLPNPTGEPIEFVDIAAAVRNDGGEAVGVLAAHLSWTWAREVQNSLLRPAGERHGADLLIVSEEKRVLLASQRGLQGAEVVLSGLRAARLGDAHYRVERWPDGREYLTGYAFADGHLDYPGLGWTIVARQPVEEAFAEAYRLRGHMMWVGMVMALLFAALAWCMADYLARPLRRLADGAVRLRRGEIERLPTFTGSSEMRRLSLVLGQLVLSLVRRDHALERMSGLANTDALTGLPNRLALDGFVRRVRDQGDGTALAWLAVDLDGFKAVNDTYGHAAGDALLREVASRLRACVRQGDLLARHGGDEFSAVIRVRGDQAADEALQVATRMLEAMRDPIPYHDAALRVGTSVGIAVWPRDAASLEEVSALADLALYDAKAAGRGNAVLWLRTEGGGGSEDMER